MLTTMTTVVALLVSAFVVSVGLWRHSQPAQSVPQILAELESDPRK
jgi:hypothetical protein